MSELERQPRIQNYTSRFLLKPGKYAYVQNPEYQKKARDFLEEAQGFWKPDKWYYHYASGGHVAAVRSHLKSGVFAHLDISSFYNSVTKAKIIRSLKMIGYSFVEANEIAAESTVLMEGRYVLPYGFCQSPYLATLALAKSELGQRLKRLRRSGFRISLYVDDLIISSDGEDRTNLQSAVDEITRAAAKANFRLNERKYSPPADNVTAFNIKVKKGDMAVTAERIDDFRSQLTGAPTGQSTTAVLKYVESVNAAQAGWLAKDVGVVSGLNKKGRS